jgi:hypothetical protein
MGKDVRGKIKHGGAAKVARKLATKTPGSANVVAPTKAASNKKNVRMVKRLNFMNKVDTAVKEKLAAKRGDASFNVLSLGGALEDVPSQGKASKKDAAKPAASVRKNKAKKNLQLKEIQQFKAVLAHGAFQANPFATIREHLTNTVKPAR